LARRLRPVLHFRRLDRRPRPPEPPGSWRRRPRMVDDLAAAHRRGPSPGAGGDRRDHGDRHRHLDRRPGDDLPHPVRGPERLRPRRGEEGVHLRRERSPDPQLSPHRVEQGRPARDGPAPRGPHRRAPQRHRHRPHDRLRAAVPDPRPGGGHAPGTRRVHPADGGERNMTELLPTRQASDLRRGVIDYVTTAISLADPSVASALDAFLTDEDSGIFLGPYLRTRLPFAGGSDVAAARELVPSLPEWFEPYAHQAAAFSRLTTSPQAPGEQDEAGFRLPQPTIVTTGTGSGKTESFLYPVLDHAARARKAGIG